MSDVLELHDLIPADRTLRGVDDIPVLLHLGPHKTGSTWLQKRFFPGVDNIVHSPDIGLTHRAFLQPRFGEFSIARAISILDPLLQEARRTGRPLVLSDEALGGRAFGQKYYREIVALRLRQVFPAARLLVLSRRQETIFPSIYGEYLRYGHASPLEAFMAGDSGNALVQPIVDDTYYEWDRVLAFYREVFGERSVLMVPMEAVVGDAPAMAATLGEFLNRPLQCRHDAEMRAPERPALSVWAMATLRLANRFVPQDSRARSRLKRLSPNSLAWQVDRITPRGVRARTAAVQLAFVRDRLGDRFALSNLRYAQMTGHDLAPLGYRLPQP